MKNGIESVKNLTPNIDMGRCSKR